MIVMALGLPVILWTGYVQRVTRRALTATPTFTPGGTPAPVKGTMATMALKAAPHVSWYRTAKGGAYALSAFVVVVAAFMLMRALGVGPIGSLMASGRLKSKEPLLITDFHTTNVDSALGRVTSDAVRAGLSQSSVITLMSPSAIASGLRLMERPPLAKIDLALARQLAPRVGVKAIVDGDVTGVGSGYIVVLRLVTADSGIELWSARETGDGPRGLIDATDRLARALRGKAGESLRAVQGAEPLEQVTTSSLDALRKFSEGVRYHDVLNDWPNAIARFREAVAIDSEFAMAWRKLGAALGNSGRPHAEVDEALEQAHRHRAHLTENERDYEEAYYYVSGPGADRAKGIARYEALLRRGEPGSAVNLALAYLSRRQFARAESADAISIRDNPGLALGWYEIAWMQADQGHWTQAEASVAAARLRYPESSLRPFVLGDLLYHRGALDSLQQFIDSVRAHGRLDLRVNATGQGSSLALLRGRVARALTLAAEATELNAAIGGTANVVADSASVTRMEIATMGESPRGVQRLDATLAKSPMRTMSVADRPYFSVATAYARAGRADRARAIMAEYDRDVRDSVLRRVQQPAWHDARGEIALAENKPAEAIVEFRRGDRAADGPAHECAICLPINLARAFDAGRQSDSAIAMYEQYLATPAIGRLDPPLFIDFGDPMDPVYLAGVHRRLAALYEAKGEVPKAAEHYRAFIELWKNADPELQPRVAEARRRLAALAPVEGGKR
jgi:tetratricopeptide (TPR) repeat protein